jgi:cysteine desulfurase
VAALVRARPDEVVFVSGGTEGDHLALVGGARARRDHGRRVAISSIEHHAVHGAAEVLADDGFAVDHLPVDATGMLVMSSMDHLAPDTGIVSLMLANNETGVLQPVAEAAERAHRAGALLHSDAVQAAGKIAIDVQALDADYLVISGHKLGGPKGAGALILKRGTPLEPLFRGSAHERGRRGGTENVPGIVGLGVAAERAAAELAEEGPRLRALRSELEKCLRAADPELVIHGERAPRLPNTVNASFPGARSDHLLLALDARGVAVSAGAACASGAVEPSPVLRAMGVPPALAVCALRLSLGRTSTPDEVAAFARVLPEALRAARGVSVGAT